MRLQENPYVFFMKNGRTQSPYSFLTATMALLGSSHCILLHSNGALMAILSALTNLNFNCDFMALTMHGLCVHDVCTALTACYRRSDISKNAVQSQCKRHGLPLCTSAEFLLYCRRSYSVPMATIRPPTALF